MRRAPSIAAFVTEPIPSWIDVNATLFWVHSPTLCGITFLGTPGGQDAELALGCLQVRDRLAPQYDVLIDAAAVATIDPVALAAVVTWAQPRIDELNSRVRRHIAVLPVGAPGFTLAGLTHVLGGPGRDLIVPDAYAGLRLLIPEQADAIHDELRAIRDGFVASPGWLVSLRQSLERANGSLPIDAAARSLGLSARSLQRALAERGTSYRRQVAEARFAIAAQMLRGSDEKIAVIARRLGLTEGGLNQLVHAFAGVTPGELRGRVR